MGEWSVYPLDCYDYWSTCGSKKHFPVNEVSMDTPRSRWNATFRDLTQLKFNISTKPNFRVLNKIWLSLQQMLSIFSEYDFMFCLSESTLLCHANKCPTTIDFSMSTEVWSKLGLSKGTWRTSRRLRQWHRRNKWGATGMGEGRPLANMSADRVYQQTRW